MANAGYKVAFQFGELYPAAREGWSVLVLGSAHHVMPSGEQERVAWAGAGPWPGGPGELFLRIRPARITGRRITRLQDTPAPAWLPRPALPPRFPQVGGKALGHARRAPAESGIGPARAPARAGAR